MEISSVRAVLFARRLLKVARFYSQALGMKRVSGDDDHVVLGCRGFELIIHQIPKHVLQTMPVERRPKRRVSGAIRLDYPVRNLKQSRQKAKALGGGIDAAPPEWADAGTNFFFGWDPEGNQFGVSQKAG